MALLQRDLDSVRRQWNTHRIRPSAGAVCPPGVPDELYFLPVRPAVDRLITDVQPLSDDILDLVEVPRTCEDTGFEAYLQYLCDFHQWRLPSDVESAIELYHRLLPLLWHFFAFSGCFALSPSPVVLLSLSVITTAHIVCMNVYLLYCTHLARCMSFVVLGVPHRLTFKALLRSGSPRVRSPVAKRSIG